MRNIGITRTIAYNFLVSARWIPKLLIEEQKSTQFTLSPVFFWRLPSQDVKETFT